MIKPFLVIVFFLIFMLFAMGVHGVLFPYGKAVRSMQQITTLIHMAPLSLSISYDESKYNLTYPEMPGLSRMDFIYEK